MNKRRRSNRSGGGCIGALANILTLIFLLGICGVFVGFWLVYNNPELNPVEDWRPIIVPTFLPTATPTETPPVLPPTFTPGPSNTPVSTPTLRPSSTPFPTETPFSLVTPPTPDPRASPTPVFPYIIDAKHPLYLDYNVINTSLACNFMGVGGNVFDLNAAPQKGLIIELGGTIQGLAVSGLAVSGTAQSYGQSGYELPISDGPIASSKTLYVQLKDQAGVSVSDKIFFDTFEDCTQNLILINFYQTR